MGHKVWQTTRYCLDFRLKELKKSRQNSIVLTDISPGYLRNWNTCVLHETCSVATSINFTLEIGRDTLTGIRILVEVGLMD